VVSVVVDIDEARFENGAGTGSPQVVVKKVVPGVRTKSQTAKSEGEVSGGPGVSGAGGLRHRLEDFVVGTSNELAYACAERIVDEHHEGCNPLFIHGGCGLGKTHLLQGACRRMLEKHPGAKVLYITGEQFTNEFLTAIRMNKLSSFRRRLRKLDLLAVDDVRFFENKEKTQQEFLHTFDAIELGGSRVILASDNHPRFIKQFSEALVSRCIRGMVVQIKPPDVDTRRRVVAALAIRRRLVLSEGVAEMIADQCSESIREIEGVLAKVHALASLTRKNPGEAVGRSLVDHLFESEMRHAPSHAVKFDTIVSRVCEEMNVTTRQALGAGRHANVVLARSLIVYLARQMTSMSFPEIATAMGRSNHSTIVCASQRIERQIEADKQVLLPQRGEQISVGALAMRLKQMVVRG